MKNPPTTEERVWAVLAHLSALALGMGILVPVVGWAEQRQKSNYTAFQCLQALGYQSLGYTFWVLGSFVVVLIQSLFTVRELVSASESGEDPAVFLGPVMSLHFVVMMVLIGVYFVPPVIAAVAAAMGRNFQYPFMGARLARYVGYTTPASSEPAGLIEEHEDRWVAAMGHFSVIIMVWGMLLPLTAWVLQGKRGQFLRFQTIQTLVYQICTTLLVFGMLFFYIFGIFAILGTLGLSNDFDLGSPVTFIGVAIFFISILIVIVIVLLIPCLHILGQWAGLRVLKGDNYRYPWLGRLIEKRLSKNVEVMEEKSV